MIKEDKYEIPFTPADIFTYDKAFLISKLT